MITFRKELVFTAIIISVITFGFFLQFLFDFISPNDPDSDEMDKQTIENNLLQFRIQDGDIQNEFFRNESPVSLLRFRQEIVELESGLNRLMKRPF